MEKNFETIVIESEPGQKTKKKKKTRKKRERRKSELSTSTVLLELFDKNENYRIFVESLSTKYLEIRAEEGREGRRSVTREKFVRASKKFADRFFLLKEGNRERRDVASGKKGPKVKSRWRRAERKKKSKGEKYEEEGMEGVVTKENTRSR